MDYVYHGSHEQNLKKISPRKSTHGTYVYATTELVLAVHFSKRCGDDLTYDIGHFSNENGPWELVENIPGAFDKMYANSFSIYKVPSKSFKNIDTGFNEVVSEEEIDVIDELQYDNVLDALYDLEKRGLIKIYRCPNKPKGLSNDGNNYIKKWRYYKYKLHKEFKKYEFDRFVLLHPELLDKINLLANEFGYDYHYVASDLLELFRKSVEYQLLNIDNEQYIDSSYISICNNFPDLKSELEKVYNEYIKKYIKM